MKKGDRISRWWYSYATRWTYSSGRGNSRQRKHSLKYLNMKIMWLTLLTWFRGALNCSQTTLKKWNCPSGLSNCPRKAREMTKLDQGNKISRLLQSSIRDRLPKANLKQKWPNPNRNLNPRSTHKTVISNWSQQPNPVNQIKSLSRLQNLHSKKVVVRWYDIFLWLLWLDWRLYGLATWHIHLIMSSQIYSCI